MPLSCCTYYGNLVHMTMTPDILLCDNPGTSHTIVIWYMVVPERPNAIKTAMLPTHDRLLQIDDRDNTPTSVTLYKLL